MDILFYVFCGFAALSILMFWLARKARKSIPSSEWSGEIYSGDQCGRSDLEAEIEHSERKAAKLKNAAAIVYIITAASFIILLAANFFTIKNAVIHWWNTRSASSDF